MVAWILIVLGVFVVQTMLPASIRYLLTGEDVRARLRLALGPRDAPPPTTVLGARAERALANMHEALPVFEWLRHKYVRPKPPGERG